MKLSLDVIIKKKKSELVQVNKFIEKFSQLFNFSDKFTFNLNLVLEEIISNIFKYAYEEDEEKEVLINMKFTEKSLIIRIEDEGISFNPLNHEEPDTEMELEEREIGGLGIHLVKNIIDKIDYSRVGQKNVLTLIKNFIH